VILLYVFIIGCFVLGIVAVGLVFALAAAGYGAEDTEWSALPQEDAAESTAPPNNTVYRL